MKNLTVVLKSLILTATIGSLAACSSSPYQTGSIQQPVVVSQYAGYSLIVDASKQLWLNNRYGLNKDQKLKQTQAIYAALDSDYGKVFTWYDTTAMGAVKTVHGYPQGIGFCRVLYSTITVNGRTRQFEETACKKNLEDAPWYFKKI